MRTNADPPRITAIVVLYDSSEVIPGCLHSLSLAAPQSGVAIVVVDNASHDAGPARAAAMLGEHAVVRLTENRGFAAGVNAGLARATTPYVAVINPDLRLAPGALDRMLAALEARPQAALIGPRVCEPSGAVEPTVGVFPSFERERAHAWLLDRLAGQPGRGRPQPAAAEAVDWVSGCAWLLRRSAVETIGPLDEDYFMYVEDVDYCRRLHAAGFEVWFEPAATAEHARGTGSAGSGALPADGGRALLHYFARFHPEVPQERLAAVLRAGWTLRARLHGVRAAFGDARSAALARRYAKALAALPRTAAR